MVRHILTRLAMACACASIALTPASAQMTEVDPNDAIVSGGSSSGGTASSPNSGYEPSYDAGAAQGSTDPNSDLGAFPDTAQPSGGAAGSSADTSGGYYGGTQDTAATTTYQKDDLIGAAEGVFGKGAKGLAGVIEDILRKQGEPNGYIVGREGGGALVVGLRYGSGTLHHKVEGQRKVYWTGPSIGFDAGANAGNTFVLVYNLYDTQDLYHRYGAGEGAAYLVGGFHVSYLRRGDVVLIPVRLGVGLRLGANIGYMKFSEKQRWLPF